MIRNNQAFAGRKAMSKIGIKAEKDEMLIDALSETIGDYSSKRATILKKAFDENGAAAVAELEEEYEALLDARYELRLRALDRNHHLYAALIQAATDEVARLKTDIKTLRNISKLSGVIAAVVDIVGRIILILALA